MGVPSKHTADSESGRDGAPVQQEQFTGEQVYPRAKGSGTRCKLGVRRKPKTAEVKKPSPTSRRAGAEL